MATVVSSATMSLDGFIARDDDSVGALFDWYSAGDVEVPSANPDVRFRLTPTSAEFWRAWTSQVGALVVGRRLFDITRGWGGRHPLGAPVVVLTHTPPEDWSPAGAEDFRFVTSGIREAIAAASEIAGDGVVAVAAGTVAGQALRAGLLDAVAIDLAPVVLGSGRRYFGDVAPGTSLLRDPDVVVAPGVTHLVYRLRPSAEEGAAAGVR